MRLMLVVSIYSLAMPPSLMFQREFCRLVDADDYCEFWRQLGSCHIKRITR
jgi:hypothetical protein